jgi:hypothetical protein
MLGNKCIQALNERLTTNLDITEKVLSIPVLEPPSRPVICSTALLGRLCTEGLTGVEFREVIARLGRCGTCGRIMMFETLIEDHRCIRKLVIDLTGESDLMDESEDSESMELTEPETEDVQSGM